MLKVVEDILKVSEVKRTVVGSVSTVSETVSTMVGTTSTMNGRASIPVGRAVNFFQTALISKINVVTCWH